MNENEGIALKEPNVRDGEIALDFIPRLTITGLKPHYVYELYQWNDVADYPTDSNFEESNWISKIEITNGDDSTYVYTSPSPIRSDKQAYWAITEKLDQPE